MTDLGARMRMLRKKRGMKQVELAKTSGVTQATICRIETGEVTQPRPEILLKIGHALGVPLDYLVDEKKSLTPDDIVGSDSRAKAIFRGYEKLSEEGRKALQAFVKYLEEQEREEAADKNKHTPD